MRQDEVSAFIHDTKGGKYSALLPLLGLHQMEVAAENLRQLAKTLESLSKIKETKANIKQVDARRKAIFGSESDEIIFERIETLHAKYCGDNPITKDALSRCADLMTALELRAARLSADERQHIVLRDVAELDLKRNVDSVRTATGKLAAAIDPLIAEKLAVLQSTEVFLKEAENGRGDNVPGLWAGDRGL